LNESIHKFFHFIDKRPFLNCKGGIFKIQTNEGKSIRFWFHNSNLTAEPSRDVFPDGKWDFNCIDENNNVIGIVQLQLEFGEERD